MGREDVNIDEMGFNSSDAQHYRWDWKLTGAQEESVDCRKIYHDDTL